MFHTPRSSLNTASGHSQGPRLRCTLFLVCFNPMFLFQYSLRTLPEAAAFVFLFSLFVLTPRFSLHTASGHSQGPLPSSSIFFVCFNPVFLFEYSLRTLPEAHAFVVLFSLCVLTPIFSLNTASGHSQGSLPSSYSFPCLF